MYPARGRPYRRDRDVGSTATAPEEQAAVELWYLAYGSNTHPDRLRRYIGDGVSPADRWCRIPHALYFAGASRRWEGGVAFVELAAGPARTPARAWRLSADQLRAIVAGENGRPVPDLPDTAGMAPGEVMAVPVAMSADGTLGKYDAILRLPDIDGRPAVTVTTTRHLPRRPPCADYLAACMAGLADGGPHDAGEHLRAAARRSTTGEVRPGA